MFLLDTTVVSEVMKTSPEAGVLVLADNVPGASLSVSAVTQAELLYGIAILPPGGRRDDLTAAARTTFETYFHRRVLPSDIKHAAISPTLNKLSTDTNCRHSQRVHVPGSLPGDLLVRR